MRADVVTLTLNPCVDRTLWVEQFGSEPLRTDAQTGGKGVNVARVLGNLGIGAVAVCPLGGETGNQFRYLAQEEGVRVASVEVTSPTRVIDTYARTSDFAQDQRYVRGGELTEDELDALERELFITMALADAQCLAVCGSASCASAARRVPGIIRRAKSMGKQVLLDSNGDALLLGAEACPDLVKPNEDELIALTGISGDPAAAAKALLGKGIGNVVASLGRAGCLWAGADFEEYCPAPQVKTVNAVGSGDSFVAGFLYACLKGYAPQAALMIACASGAANAAVFPAARVTKDEIEALLGWKLV